MYMGGWPGIAYMPPGSGIGMVMPPWRGTLCIGPAPATQPHTTPSAQPHCLPLYSEKHAPPSSMHQILQYRSQAATPKGRRFIRGFAASRALFDRHNVPLAGRPRHRARAHRIISRQVPSTLSPIHVVYTNQYFDPHRRDVALHGRAGAQQRLTA